MARLPLDPCLARMLIAAANLSCLPEALIVAAMLSAESIFAENRQAPHLLHVAHWFKGSAAVVSNSRAGRPALT